MLPLMNRLRELRTYGHPLLLIGLWAAFQAATIAVASLLAESPSVGSLRAPILGSIFLAFCLVLGWRIAWWLAIFWNTGVICVSVGFGIFEFGVKPWLVALLQVPALWLLWSGNIELHVQSHQRLRRLAEAPPER